MDYRFSWLRDPKNLDMEHLEKYDVVTLVRARQNELFNDVLRERIDNNLKKRKLLMELLKSEHEEHDAEMIW